MSRTGWRRPGARAVAAGVLAGTVIGTLLAIPLLAAAPPASVAVVEVDVSDAEAVFVAELAEAGIPLDPAGQQTAVDIARKHVAHGHLIGMRQQIRDDVRAAFPQLSDVQVEVAKTAVEHHFRDVTGKQQ